MVGLYLRASLHGNSGGSALVVGLWSSHKRGLDWRERELLDLVSLGGLVAKKCCVE